MTFFSKQANREMYAGDLLDFRVQKDQQVLRIVSPPFSIVARPCINIQKKKESALGSRKSLSEIYNILQEVSVGLQGQQQDSLNFSLWLQRLAIIQKEKLQKTVVFIVAQVEQGNFESHTAFVLGYITLSIVISLFLSSLLGSQNDYVMMVPRAVKVKK